MSGDESVDADVPGEVLDSANDDLGVAQGGYNGVTGVVGGAGRRTGELIGLEFELLTTSDPSESDLCA